ncbi:MAG TPA: hypothetical protein VMM58_09720 [Bacteroidota bacterium]|nr:hypothetical protein [Bacteroidota bacterium]
MIQNQTRVSVPASEVFPNLNGDIPTLRTILSSLSLTDTIFWCARLNNVIANSSNDSHQVRQVFGLQQFFSTEDINRINHFTRMHDGPENVQIFFRGQILELLRWIALFCDDDTNDGSTFEHPEIRRKFGQCLLIAGEIFGKRIYGKNFFLDANNDVARKRALGPIRKGIEGAMIASDLSRTLGRSAMIWKDYFPKYYRSLFEDFFTITEISVEDYLRCITSFIVHYLDPKVSTGIFDVKTFADGTKNKIAFMKYVKLESQDIVALKNGLWGKLSTAQYRDGFGQQIPPYDYQPLRNKPIVRATDGRAVILDPIFYSEKPFVGPLFLLVQNLPAKSNEIFGAFGRAFEDYACNILKRMFPQDIGALDNKLYRNMQIINDQKSKIEIDACVNSSSGIILFEMKAVWIKEETILADDSNDFFEHLRERYCAIKNLSKSTRNKGISQLVGAVETISTQEFAEKHPEFNISRVVYPVLVVYDALLDAPVFGHFLASEFKTLLAPESESKSGYMKKGKLTIAPLIVMTIEQLENLEVSIKNFDLQDFLAEYSQSCPDRSVPLHNFISSSKYSTQMIHNSRIIDKALEILLDTQEQMFEGKKDSL